MTDLFNSDLENQLIYRDENGRVVFQVGLLATLYFFNAHLPEIRAAVAENIEEYQAICGENLKWVTHPRTYYWHKTGKASLLSPKKRSDALDENDVFQMATHGGETNKDSSHFQLETLCKAKWKNELHNDLSYMRGGLPLTWYADHSGNFPSLVLGWCERVKPDQGYAGIGIIETTSGIDERHETAVYGMAKRFPGLEVDVPVKHNLHIKEGIKGGNWLTILSDRWLSKLGGVSSMKSQLGDDFIFHEYDGGVLIQAGRAPQMGDLNRQRMPELYVRLAAVLKPVRITKHRAFHIGEENCFDEEETLKWLARFDPE